MRIDIQGRIYLKNGWSHPLTGCVGRFGRKAAHRVWRLARITYIKLCVTLLYLLLWSLLPSWTRYTRWNDSISFENAEEWVMKKHRRRAQPEVWIIGNSKLAETSPRGNAEVRSKLINRFYEPIVLLWSLNDACIHNRPSKNPELTSEISRSNKHDFHHFVNKLAQLCDSERGGDTVTAFVVLEYPDHIEYRFTSNQRRIEEFDRTKHYTASLLQLLGNAEKQELPSVSLSVLRVSLSFNRSRVSYYVNTLKKEASFCISACEKESTNEGERIPKICVPKTYFAIQL